MCDFDLTYFDENRRRIHVDECCAKEVAFAFGQYPNVVQVVEPEVPEACPLCMRIFPRHMTKLAYDLHLKDCQKRIF